MLFVRQFLHPLLAPELPEEMSRTFLARCLPVLLSLAALMEKACGTPSGMTLISRQEMGKSENIFSLLSQGSSCALTFSLQWHRMM